MGSSPTMLIGRAAFGVAIGLATMGAARPRILDSGYQFPSLDDGVLRESENAVQAGKAMDISASCAAPRHGAAALRDQPDESATRSAGIAQVRVG